MKTNLKNRFVKYFSYMIILVAFAGCKHGENSTSSSKSDAIIPRKVLFGNPDKRGVSISPDGELIGFLAPKDGVMNIWIAPKDRLGEARSVTQEKKRPITGYHWAYTGHHVIYQMDLDGNENWGIRVVDLRTNTIKNLTVPGAYQSRILGLSYKYPDKILLGVNDRDPKLHDVYLYDLRTAAKEKIYENHEYMSIEVDEDLRVRLGSKYGKNGEIIWTSLDRKSKKPFLVIPADDALTTSPMSFTADGKTLYVVDSRGRDTSALFAWDLASGNRKLLLQDERADFSSSIREPLTGEILAGSFNFDRERWKFLKKDLETDFRDLKIISDGDVSVQSQTSDNKEWIVAFLKDNGPVRYYHWDRAQRKARFLFTNNKELEDKSLASMRPVEIRSRDGLNLVSYLSLPASVEGPTPTTPLPMVLFVHGGPWARDVWGFHPYHQILANRGYAVLSVNFRGSTGFGKKFLNAADKQWGAKMHDDLIDAIDWAIREKIADPGKIAIMGGSYGGYATLVGLTFTPDRFACGVDIVGPSSLVTLLESVPEYWKPMMETFRRRVGNHTTIDGRAFLESRSPLNRVDQIKKPLLIGQGANDPRVKKAESDQIFQQLKKKSIPVTYVLYPDEGHGFNRPENKISFMAVSEEFLGKCLGGKVEPVGDGFENSSLEFVK